MELREREKVFGKGTAKAGERLTFTEARMQLNFCCSILCILLQEAKKESMAGCSAKRGSRQNKVFIGKVYDKNDLRPIMPWLSPSLMCQEDIFSHIDSGLMI